MYFILLSKLLVSRTLKPRQGKNIARANCQLTKDELTTLPCLTLQRQVGGAFACAKDMTIGNGVSSELTDGL